MIHTTQTYQIGDNVELMRKMSAETIDMIVTSPPYWGLRDYGVDGQIGLEPTLEEYHARMLEVTAECMRVLKPTGVMFWNHGDSYGDKSLDMQNERLIIKMVDDQGWLLRNRIIWNKPNGMPSSVTDRFSNKYEPVYMLVKSNDTNYYYNSKTGDMQRNKPLGTNGEEGRDWDWKEVGADYSDSNTKIDAKDAEKLASPRARVHREKKTKKISHWIGRDYWFDLDAVRAPYTEPMNRWGGQKLKADGDSKYANGDVQGGYRERDMRPNPLGKNPGDVVEMTQVEWINHCHDIWDMFAEEQGDIMRIPTRPYPESHFATFPTALIEPMIKAACPEGGTVLDPFCGSGTVLEVCRLLNRNAIGLELNPEYETLIKDRSMAHTPPLTAY